MALLVLILFGMILGWLASIVMRTEAPRDILRQMGIASAAALIAGLFVNSGTFLGGVSWTALGAALVGALAALALYHVIVRRNAAV